VPDIGFGEIVVIVVIALLVFGPDRLPKVAADAARMLRQVRDMAASARKDLVDASGLKDDGEMAQTVRELRDLDPRRAMKGVLTDDPSTSSTDGHSPSSAAGAPAAGRATGRPPSGNAPGAPGTGAGPVTARGDDDTVSGSTGSVGGTGGADASAPDPAAASTEPVPDPLADAAPVDPDWT
jgi:Tat protein translocase TatB subunit